MASFPANRLSYPLDTHAVQLFPCPGPAEIHKSLPDSPGADGMTAMAEIIVEQAIYHESGEAGSRLVARSPGFLDEWLPEAVRLCDAFGDRPVGVACPACVFVQPFGNHHVAVVQVTDQSQAGGLSFRFLVILRGDYLNLQGDPFAIADKFPPVWQARGELPALVWPAEPLPPRTVADVQHVLKNFDSPMLLGSVQALVDGGRVVFQRLAPDEQLLRHIWMLLPTSTRSEIWPASFAFADTLDFHVLVAPRIENESFRGYLREDEAGDYPEGRYELSLQIAAESGDQRELDALFGRRSGRQMIRLLVILLVLFALLALMMRLLFGPQRQRKAETPIHSSCRVAQLGSCGVRDVVGIRSGSAHLASAAAFRAAASTVGSPQRVPAGPAGGAAVPSKTVRPAADAEIGSKMPSASTARIFPDTSTASTGFRYCKRISTRDGAISTDSTCLTHGCRAKASRSRCRKSLSRRFTRSGSPAKYCTSPRNSARVSPGGGSQSISLRLKA